MWFEWFVCLSFISNVLSQVTNYLFITEQLTWQNAVNKCAAMGYVLATPRNSIENNKLLDFLTTVTGRHTDVWIGGTMDQSNNWKWWNGELIENFDWSVDNNQPNDVDKEKCIRIRMEDKRWWNRQCIFMFPSVCQIDPVREASFNLLERNKSPTETALSRFSVTSAPECTLRCMDDYRCKLYSVHMTSQGPPIQYQCLLFSSDFGDVTLQDVVDTRLYSKLA